MNKIDVEGLPESVARTIEAMVKALKAQLLGHRETKAHVDLPVYPGKVLTPLNRREIYDHVG